MRVWILLVSLAACSSGDGPLATTEHCDFELVPPTARAGGIVEEAALQAGTAEVTLNIAVGAALGAFTSRAGFLGETDKVDLRTSALAGTFNASVGIETAPRIKALALTAGEESILIIKIDIATLYEGLLFDLEERLGPEFAGKVLLTASHTHSGWGHFTGHDAYQMGMGQFRGTLYQRLLEQLEDVAHTALDAREPAKIGFFADMNFDPADLITHDRRSENDGLLGGAKKDDSLFVIRVDTEAGAPLAILPVFGVHGTINGASNSLASTDAIGGMERVLEEQFDHPVMVMHLQGSGGDVSPTEHGGINCDLPPGDDPDDPCFQWNRSESLGRTARDVLLAAWEDAGSAMQTSLAIEMLSESIELGPDAETFTLRDGALRYARFDPANTPDGTIFQGSEIVSPIDEFNAPAGAGLCENDETIYFEALIPGTEGLTPYGSCATTDGMIPIFESFLAVEINADATHPICQSTRTTVSALRLGDYLIATLPGEPTIPIRDLIRSHSPVAADKTIVLGYAQGHVGYLLTPEDWLLGGYESSINLWGPLEGEYVANRALALLPLALTPEREDTGSAGATRVATPVINDTLPIDDPAPDAGTIPTELWDRIWLRSGLPALAQPSSEISRVSGLARFVWIGDDPQVATPRVRIQRQTAPDQWQDITRRSGRAVADGELIVSYTPEPLRRDGDTPQTHYWAAEFQAVPWLGAVDDDDNAIDSLDSLAGLPLGLYRFHVTGDNWELTSDPFEVTAATINISNAEISGTPGNYSLTASAAWQVDKGFRLLSTEVASNGNVPLTGTCTVTVEFSGGGTQVFEGVQLSASGDFTVAPTDNAVVHLSVTDPFDNTGELDL